MGQAGHEQDRPELGNSQPGNVNLREYTMVKTKAMTQKVIRNIDDKTYHAARIAALKEGKTVGQWITEALTLKLKSKPKP